MFYGQVLRVIGKEEPESVRSEPPFALRRAQKALPPAMDAAGLARHLSVPEVQVRVYSCDDHSMSFILIGRGAGLPSDHPERQVCGVKSITPSTT